MPEKIIRVGRRTAGGDLIFLKDSRTGLPVTYETRDQACEAARRIGSIPYVYEVVEI